MFLKNRVMAGAMMAVIAFLAACGPVKFSSSSEAEVNPLATPTPTDGGTPTPTPTPPGGGTPTPTPTPTPPPTLTTKYYNKAVTDPNYKLDIVLVVDDSNSMLADNLKMAERLSGLITKLNNNNIDWQMCTTVTRYIPIGANPEAWGASIYWQPSPRNSLTAPDTSLGWILKKGQSNVADIFTNTINYIGAGWTGSDDERGIKAAWRHAYNGDYHFGGNSGCYRADSAVTYIIISDEDERSIAGDASQQVYAGELKTLENEDKPQYFVDTFKKTFGADRRFTVNSIIVKPGDSACKTSQDSAGSKSHYGFKYAELSNLTGGGIGSICDSDYSANMDLFFGKITSSLSSVPLECMPYNGVATVAVTPNDISGLVSSVSGTSVVFNKPVTSGHTINVTYQCADRNPTSAGPATAYEAPGFFARIANFFRNLF